MNKIIHCEDLYKNYDDGVQTQVLKGVNLCLYQGQSMAIVGSSGSGKSTLLQILGGLDNPTSGSVSVNGCALHQLKPAAAGRFRNQHLGFVYQFHHLLAELTALENVAMPLLIRGNKTQDACRAAENMLARVGLGARMAHKPAELSGGERQRAAIARALVGAPSCVLADEPTGNLDSTTANHIVDLLLSLQADIGTSFIVVTHDTTLAARLNSCQQLQNGVLAPIDL